MQLYCGLRRGDKGTSEPPKPKPIAADLKDLPNKDVKVGASTFKLFTLKNNPNLHLENTFSNGHEAGYCRQRYDLCQH